MWKGLFLFLCVSCASCASLWESSKEKAELHMRLGSAHYEQGNYPVALTEMLEAERLDSSSPLIQNNLGLIYYVRDRLPLAEKHIRKALDLKNDFTDARNNLARILIDQKKYEEAEKELKIVLNDLTYTGADKAWSNFGISRFMQKDWNGARQAFAKSIQLNRDQCIAQAYYGRTFFETGDYTRATESLDRAVAFCQKANYDEPHYYSALSWYRLGEKEKSMARFEEVSKLYHEGKFRDKARAMIDLMRKGTP